MVTTSQASPDQTEWARSRLEDSIGLRQVDFANSIQRMRAKERMLRRLGKKTMDGTIGKQTVEPQDSEANDMIVLGNYTINANSGVPQEAPRPQQPPAQEQGPTQQPVQQPAPQQSGAASPSARSRAWPWILAGLSLTAGAGVASIPWLLRPTGADTWMEYDFQKYQPQGETK